MTNTEKPFRSFSQLSLYAACGELFRRKKIDLPRPPEQPAAWLVHGNALHAAYPLWEEAGRHGQIAEYYIEQWDLELAKQMEVQPDWEQWALTPRVKTVEQDLKLRKEAGIRQAANFQLHVESAEWYPAELDDGQLALEVDFVLEFDENFARGYIDLVKYWPKEKAYTICDLKTGSPQDDYRQLSLYALAAREVLGLDVTLGEYWYTKLDAVPRSGDGAGRSSGMRQVGRPEFGRDYWNHQFTMLERGIRNEIFIHNPSRSCEISGLCSTP